MSELVLGFAPIVVMWLLPLAPMFYAAVVGTYEFLTSPARSRSRVPKTSPELAT